jgi:hypothetical protein
LDRGGTFESYADVNRTLAGYGDSASRFVVGLRAFRVLLR